MTSIMYIKPTINVLDDFTQFATMRALKSVAAGAPDNTGSSKRRAAQIKMRTLRKSLK